MISPPPLVQSSPQLGGAVVSIGQDDAAAAS
jgi:hypothetical protein